MNIAAQLREKAPKNVIAIVPAYNEAERVGRTVHTLKTMPHLREVIVVDDGSDDATSAVAKDAGAVVVRHPGNRGKAEAMVTGAKMASKYEAENQDPLLPGQVEPGPAALLFIDADMQETAAEAQPLLTAVLEDGVDMAIANLPPQPGASGMGIVVRTARDGIEKETGFVANQPLSGTRCITRECWEACQPVASGWGVETSLTIDAVRGGFIVKEIPCELKHRATGKSFKDQLHRAAQLLGVRKALRGKRISE